MWALTVGRACANIFHNIESIRKTAGLTPVLIYTDSLWFVSNDPDPETAVPGIIEKQDKLGGYKVVYNQPLAMSKEVIDAWTSIDSPTKLVRHLNILAGEDDTVVEKATVEVGV